MTLYDSSVLIDFLAGDETVENYIHAQSDHRAITLPLVLFEIYQGEIYKSDPADFNAIDGALGWLTIVEETRDLARAAAELQNRLANDGTPLAARDAYIAGAAETLGETLVVSDADFDVDGITQHLDLDLL